jgi:hypothetical protein
MNNALIDSRKPALFAALRRWDLAVGRKRGEAWRGALKKIVLLLALKLHFDEAMDENENLVNLGNRQGEGTHHFVRYARDEKSFQERT